MDLGKTQAFSIFTKAVTTVLGVIQSIIIIRLMTKGEYGLVGVVISVGSLVGVSQHLGVVDGAIREIAVLKTDEEVGKVYWVSHFVRQIVTIPLTLGMIALAGVIAESYHLPAIAPFIRLYGVVLIIQGLQDVMGATLTGIKAFKPLYVIQMITAAINILVFGYLTWLGHVNGYFWAIVLTTLLMTLLFSIVIGRRLSGHLGFPTMTDMRYYGRRVMKVGAYTYISRILFMVWQRIPILMLAARLNTEQLGDLNISSTVGTRLTILAAALSEVNLTWMSTLFARAKDEFRKAVEHNMQRVLLLMTGLTMGLIFITPEAIHIVKAEYEPAIPLIIITTVAFFFYALMDIGTSSLLVPADESRMRMIIFIVMTAATGLLTVPFLFITPNLLFVSTALLVGVLVGYVVMALHAKERHQVIFVTPHLGLFLAGLLVSAAWLLTAPSLLPRLVVLCILAIYILWTSHKQQLLPKKISNAISQPAQQEVMGNIVCFAGALYDQPAWTNRQHMMSRASQRYRVLYVEPRLWIVTLLKKNWRKGTMWSLWKRLFWYEKKHNQLFIKAQWNLIPGSREIKLISTFNHFFNRIAILFIADLLHFRTGKSIMWLYDTEAAEYVPAFKKSFVLYDCVDDHAVQSGIDRNPKRVYKEEALIMKRADVVTVTSKKLYEMKKDSAKRVELVLNSGDVANFLAPQESAEAQEKLGALKHPVIGTVGALDSYKFDLELLATIAQKHLDWQFVFVGSPVVDSRQELAALKALPNTHFVGMVPHEQVPAFVSYFDVCLIPYRNNEYNKASFPLKFWEFMATGKPVVVSGVPELKDFDTLIGYAETVTDFTNLVEEWLQHPQQGTQERSALALEHTWEKRVETILSLLN